jgi:hypothetical protein
MAFLIALAPALAQVPVVVLVPVLVPALEAQPSKVVGWA